LQKLELKVVYMRDKCLAYVFAQSDCRVFFVNLNVYFLKTTNRPVHGNIAWYKYIALFV